MKKALRVILISLLSVVVLLLAGVVFITWFAFTPARLSPVVQTQVNKYVSCESHVGEVELTFFSTFPRFGIKVDNLVLVNPVDGAVSDTLIRMDQMVGVIDIVRFWRKDELILSELSFKDGFINAFVDSMGIKNFDVFPVDTTTIVESDTLTPMPFINISSFELSNVDLIFVDDSLKINSSIRNLNGRLSGTVENNLITGQIEISRSEVSLVMAGETLIDQAGITLNMPVQFDTSRYLINLHDAHVSVNELELRLNGSVEMEEATGDIIPRLEYKLQRWPLKTLLALVPSSYLSKLEGIDFTGLLSSVGSVSGLYNDSVMPLMDINLTLEKGNLRWSALPVPLQDIVADINVYTDLKDDKHSYVKINQFKAKTPHSLLASTGMVYNLFSDMHFNFQSDMDLLMEEVGQLLPDSIEMSMKGRVTGNIKSEFSMSHVEKNSIEKMKLSGNLVATRLDVTYDSLWIKTPRTRVEFQLPSRARSGQKPAFALTGIDTDLLEAGKLGQYQAFLGKSRIDLEISDPRDTTRIPSVACTFSLDSLSATMDTMLLNLSQPRGKLAVAPVANRLLEPHINLEYRCEGLTAASGKDSIYISKLDISTEVVNDEAQKDIFLKWLVKGFIDMEQGRINLAMLTSPVEIPAIKMEFEPEKLDIRESRIVIEQSDFRLSGVFKNVLSYFRGDSILRGKFDFESNTTDILQLMNLTNGLGNADSLKPATAEDNSSSSGPYIVPRGIDLQLNTLIEQASFGIDTATNIQGTLRVKDGILLLDEYSFATSAARMQLTAIYRTPRKNHLYLGLNYQMMDIEIEQLLKIIPDIDSLMPMLRSFKGRGEFRIAMEGYLDSTYTIKKSTLLGASSIKGENLVLLDGETFSEIARTLRFNKKTENRVDTLSAEFTIFREEIDVYPFLLVMDKYKAVVAGRHNFDLTFDYHISVVDSPLPAKFGIDVAGDLDKLRYRPALPRYAEFYRPASRRVVENKQLELRRMIRQSISERINL